VLVVEDDPIARDLVARLLAAMPGVSARFAGDAETALAEVGRAVPDLVLTDMKLPFLDGLDLMNRVRGIHPGLPVVIMTAYGSEELAVQAVLEKGAASYVPKAYLVRDLRRILADVLAAQSTERQHQRLHGAMRRAETEFLIENDPALVTPLVSYLQQQLAWMRLRDEEGRIRAGLALHEALANAITHGNLELSSELREEDAGAFYKLMAARRAEPPYRDRRVHLAAKVTTAEATYVVRDEGPGFDPCSVRDPMDPTSVGRLSGRGLLLIRAFMDHVEHNAKGNEITMVLRGNA
jgi:CheY-like chemotaxis protein/anti-sigma regulatory factor (Ser/Thr protein kinase)